MVGKGSIYQEIIIEKIMIDIIETKKEVGFLQLLFDLLTK